MVLWFKLYLYGIEIAARAVRPNERAPFKLYLYGIEITKTDPTAFVPAGSNCTFMELKFGYCIAED